MLTINFSHVRNGVARQRKWVRVKDSPGEVTIRRLFLANY